MTFMRPNYQPSGIPLEALRWPMSKYRLLIYSEGRPLPGEYGPHSSCSLSPFSSLFPSPSSLSLPYFPPSSLSLSLPPASPFLLFSNVSLPS